MSRRSATRTKRLPDFAPLGSLCQVRITRKMLQSHGTNCVSSLGGKMEFEWDEQKRLSNIEKHGIDFQRARAIFDGLQLVHLTSPYPEENRMLTVTILDGVYATAVWTERGRRIRFISVRRSRNREKDLYRQKLGS